MFSKIFFILWFVFCWGAAAIAMAIRARRSDLLGRWCVIAVVLGAIGTYPLFQPTDQVSALVGLFSLLIFGAGLFGFRRVPVTPGMCRGCGYDLRNTSASESPKCPECGVLRLEAITRCLECGVDLVQAVVGGSNACPSCRAPLDAERRDQVLRNIPKDDY